ncbi:MAG: hypothetical protein HND56_09305 [Pseudomonadota bacterium]|jgi:hypothetical protein|nr:hypothetical protein [Pseudomonadota bacterium]QKK05872.1 MAG: hypothetical protein HND56_09305 [Pseudomonadota bacterium]
MTTVDKPNLSEGVFDIDVHVTLDAMDKKEERAMKRGEFLKDFTAVLAATGLGFLEANAPGAAIAFIFGAIGLFAKYSGIFGGNDAEKDCKSERNMPLRPAMATVPA